RLSCPLFVGLVVLSSAPVRGADVEKLLPGDTQLVVNVNVRQILDSAVVKKYLLPEMEEKANSEIAKVVRLLGLNPVKEITSVAFATPGGTDQGKWVGVVSGDFDPGKIQAAVDQFAKGRPDAVAVRQQGKVRIYEDLSSKEGQTSWPRYFALVDRHT